MTLTALPGSAAAQLEMPPIIGDGMVVQRDAPVPVRGRAAPGSSVRLSFAGELHSATADADGEWVLVLPPRPAGGPYEMVISSEGERVTAHDVWVGDVWIASGQSNMEWPVADSRDAVREIAGANDPLIRHFRVPRSWSYRPEAVLAGGEWEVSDSAHVGDHSAVAYFFARSLRPHVDVPIGIINNSWGGARLEPYMSASALGLDGADAAAIREMERANEEALLDDLRRRIGGLPESDRGMSDGRPVWADPDLDVSDWEHIAVPGYWESAGYEGLNGVAWYRRTFELSVEEAAAPVRLGLGRIDDADITWVNGHEVGRMEQAWNRVRTYEVPPGTLRPGRNVLAVRVADTGGGGGILGDADLLYIETTAGRRSLVGEWRFRVGSVARDFEGDKNQVPTLLYNHMVHPLVDYPIRGVIWYQGESNAYPGDAYEYRDLFRTMIRSWRMAWGQDDLPFLWVQLASYMEPGDGTKPSDWAVLRESQTAALSLPATGQAVAIDLGDADDIHPRNKQDVGRRLALAARAVAYGEDIVHSGPMYRSHRVLDDGVIELDFDHVDGGLQARDGPLGGFVVAGPDGRFVPARAVIEGPRVLVWSEAVAEPWAVRYAWADNPIGAN
ncbi:MAG: sialate O-acetylesterase, partial [Gemmatimonadota bacterium]